MTNNNSDQLFESQIFEHRFDRSRGLRWFSHYRTLRSFTIAGKSVQSNENLR